jgi:light-regulated signal transduction histidine kinase (bacteriophytochrome)
LAQLFQNLIGNAVKYRSDERNPEIEISAKEQGDQVVFSVKDNGMGIEEKFFGKVFGVFQRLHGQGEKYKGTGIGLSLCNKVVQKHGGKIWVESTLGKGSTFYFTMPKARIKIGGV